MLGGRIKKKLRLKTDVLLFENLLEYWLITWLANITSAFSSFFGGSRLLKIHIPDCKLAILELYLIIVRIYELILSCMLKIMKGRCLKGRSGGTWRWAPRPRWSWRRSERSRHHYKQIELRPVNVLEIVDLLFLSRFICFEGEFSSLK